MAVNNSALTLMGNRCGNSTVVHTCCASGNALSLLDYSLLYATDAQLQAIGRWLSQNRLLVGNYTRIELNGIFWDILSSKVETFTYFVMVGMDREQVRYSFGVTLASIHIHS